METQQGEERRRVTLKDLAGETGLSVTAVSYALRGLQVSEDTKSRVRAAAERLGYHPDPHARALASGRTGTVALLCESLDDLWQQSVAAALGGALQEAGLSTWIVDVGNDPELEAREARRVTGQRVDALLTIPADPRAPHWAELAEETALISIGDALPGAAAAAEIVFDNERGVREGLDQLARAGHRRIAFLTPNLDDTPDRPAERIVRTLADEAGLEVAVVPTPYDLDAVAEIVVGLLSGADRPTGFFCLADSIAHGVYAAAARLGLRIPEDLSVIGYDDRPVSRLLSPPLSSFQWPLDEIVALVVTETQAAIREGVRGHRTVLVATRQPRASVGPPPATT